VLSDPVKRKQYDSTRSKSEYSESTDEENNNKEDDLIKAIDDDWNEVLEYFPDLKNITQRLGTISKSLEFSYKIILLDNKEFNNREKIANLIELHFLQRYFGTNRHIIEFAKKLIFSGDKNSAKELNRAVNLLGSEVDPQIIINKIKPAESRPSTDKNKKPEFNQNFSHLNEYHKSQQHSAKDEFIQSKSIANAMSFLKSINVNVYREDISWNAKFTVINKGKSESMSANELIKFATSLL
jgi:hypothetical protein